ELAVPARLRPQRAIHGPLTPAQGANFGGGARAAKVPTSAPMPPRVRRERSTPCVSIERLARCGQRQDTVNWVPGFYIRKSRARRLNEVEDQPLGDDCRLVLVLDIDDKLELQQPLAGAALLGLEQLGACADALAHFYRRHETQLVEAVVHAHLQ